VQLSKKLFAEITGVDLVSLANREQQADRRSHGRIPFDRRARIFPLMEGVGEGGSAVLIRDISLGGIGFLHAEAIGVGDEFVIRLLTAVDEPIDIQCAARHCEMGGTCGSQFAVGATFELVLNRPLSDSVAPESELPVEQEPLIDQPAEPTIEQRYDQQCVTSRLIRPMIRETRWDRWMAKPPVQKVNRVLARIFWPGILLARGIHTILHAGEESRIRSRLNPSKSGKKWRPKKRTTPNAVPAPVERPEPAIAEKSAVDAPSWSAMQASIFGNVDATNATALTTTAPIQTGSGRRSLFTKDDAPASAEPQIQTVLPPPPAIIEPTVIVPPLPAIVEPAVAQPVVPVETIVVAEPIAPVATPAIEVEVKITGQPESAPEPLNQPLPQTSVAQPLPEPRQAVQPATPAIADDAPMQHVDQPRSTPSSPKARPPVAHPRQIRRRPRPSYLR
jgi:hypothetical protein